MSAILVLPANKQTSELSNILPLVKPYSTFVEDYLTSARRQE
jgi:hypothetical protein